MEARIEVGGAGVAVEHLWRDFAVRRVLARLEQEHLVGALARQPVGQHRPGRAAADDDEVVMHRCPPVGVAIFAQVWACDEHPSSGQPFRVLKGTKLKKGDFLIA